MDEKSIVSAYLPTAQRNRLVSLANANQRSLSGEVRRALDVYLRIEDPGVASTPPLGRPAEGERRGSPVGPAASSLGEDA